MTDIVDLIKTWAEDLDAPVPPVIPTEYALLAVNEIERLRTLVSGKTYTLNDDLQWVSADYVPEDIDDPTAHGKYIAQLNDIVHTQVERIRQIEDECQKLANYLMHELVFVHERLIEEVDIALIPYLGNSTPLE